MGRALSEYDAKQMLADAGIPVVEDILVETEEAAVEAAQELGFPVIMKADAPGLQHKTDIGAVLTAHDVEEVRKRFQALHDTMAEHAPDLTLDGILVEEHVDGVELIIGTNQDPDFGPVIMFGMGGIFVEVLEDVNFRSVPIDEEDARSLIGDMRTQALLDGVRGQDPVDRDSIVDVLLAVSDLLQDRDDIEELDINPLFADADGTVAADALITVSSDG